LLEDVATALGAPERGLPLTCRAARLRSRVSGSPESLGIESNPVTEDYTERFSTVPLFEGLDYKEITSLIAHAEDISASAGEEIVRQGSPGDGFYIISAGEFEVLKSGTDSKVLAKLENFSYFGEMSLVTDEVRSASVICVKDGRLKKFARDQFNALLDEGSLVAYKVIRNMCRILAKRLSKSDSRLVS